MGKKISALVFVLLAVIMVLPGVNASAAPDLKVSVTTGFDGKSKYDKGAPAQIKIENSGTAFSGDLVIDIQSSYNLGSGRAIPLDIESGESKTISLVMPSSEDHYGHGFGSGAVKRIFLYEGGWEKGKELKHKGAQQFSPASYGFDSAFVFMFTNNIDRLSALKKAKGTQFNNAQYIDGSKIDGSILPDELLGWEMIDIIVMDEYPLADLPQQKQEALLAWVRSGGKLFIGSSDNINTEVGIFSEYLPLKLGDRNELDPGLLNNWANTEEFSSPIPSFKASLAEGAKSILSDGDATYIASSEVGTGVIYQTAFSFGDDPISKMEGMPALWETLIDLGGFSIQPHYNQMNQSLGMLSNHVGYTNEIFPSFKVSAPLLSGIILLYIILIIPILYFILKKKDKREYTWWIIPLVAVVTSIAIFGYGAKDRIGRAQIQHTAVVNAQLDGKAKGYFAEAILSNKSGDYTFTSGADTTLTASVKQDLFGNNSQLLHNRAMVEKDVAASSIHLRNVGYWNVASAYGETTFDEVGQLLVDLTVSNKKLVGTIQNDYPFGLTDVAIWSGSKLLPIGDIGPGETVEVEEALKLSFLLSASPMNNNYMGQPQINNDDLMEMRKEGTLQFLSELIQESKTPILIAYTDTQLIPVEVEKNKTTLSALTLISQPFEVEMELEGELTLEPGMMDMSIVSEDGNMEPDMYDFQMNIGYFSEAVYLQKWKIGEKFLESNINWTSLDVTKIQKELYDLSVLNHKTGLFEVQPSGKVKITENPSNYISPQGEIDIQIVFHKSREGNEASIPELRLTGEVTK
ncbi:hypothetical protein ACFSFY_13460 [Sporosarcina siberiensis]|uniref:Uncharacterized protein n=1 Tax=Sporosarcina siberiensis TaxID=1365606 RepID=A0ABW4SHR9_9BACL